MSNKNCDTATNGRRANQSNFDDMLALFTEHKPLEPTTYQSSIDNLCKALLQLAPAKSR